jgi:excisionase family DNA binding protein
VRVSLAKRQSDTLTPKQAAELCGVDRTTMRRWLLEEAIPHTVTPGGWRRIGAADLANFMRAHGIPTPEWLDPGPGRVLLVDDEPAVTNALERILRRSDRKLQVKAVHDGFGAGVMALSFQPHVMILDLVMPGMDGVEVCRWALTEPRLSGMAIIILSGHLDAASKEQLLALGAKACLDKPARPEQLLEVIRTYLPASTPRGAQAPAPR